MRRCIARLIDTAQIYSNHEDIAEACSWKNWEGERDVSVSWLDDKQSGAD